MNWASIHNIREKIKYFFASTHFQEVFVILLILCVGLVGFGLGILSERQQNKQEVYIQENSEVNKDMSSISIAQNPIVASRSGTKYYFLWCSGSNRIKESNKIYFKDEKQARKRGLLPASNCKGLK